MWHLASNDSNIWVQLQPVDAASNPIVPLDNLPV